MLPLLWMGLIYYASAQERVAVTENFLLSFVIFKTLHLIEYGILFVLWRYALPGTKKAGFLAAAIAISYGAFDELHQSYVPTREGRLRDVAIDSAGVLIAWQLFWPKIKEKVERR